MLGEHANSRALYAGVVYGQCYLLNHGWAQIFPNFPKSIFQCFGYCILTWLSLNNEIMFSGS